MADKQPKPIPGTWGAIERSTEPWNWRAMLKALTFTPDELAARLAQYVEEQKAKNKHG